MRTLMGIVTVRYVIISYISDNIAGSFIRAVAVAMGYTNLIAEISRYMRPANPSVSDNAIIIIGGRLGNKTK